MLEIYYLVSAVAFVGFFIIAGVAVLAVERYPDIKKLFVFVLISGVLFGGVVFSAWPFFTWSLYGEPIPENLTNHEVVVVDSDGSTLKYDARAAAPALATPLNRHATYLATDATQERQRETGCFLLREAIEYRNSIGTTDFQEMGKFPPHQIGFKWTESRLSDFGQITTLRVRKVVTEFSGDGTTIESRTSKPVLNISKEKCS